LDMPGRVRARVGETVAKTKPDSLLEAAPRARGGGVVKGRVVA